MINNFENTVARNANLKSYLNQLSEVAGCEVAEAQLSSLEEVEKLKGAAVQLNGCSKKVVEIVPEDLKKERFAALVKRLAKVNSSRVTIWLDATSSCGTLYLSGVDEFNFSFRFDAIPEGVIVLLTADGKDKLLLDFSPDEVELELQGVGWGDVDY